MKKKKETKTKNRKSHVPYQSVKCALVVGVFVGSVML